ncbi:hypothetical protein NDU88_000644 [Pleurodeles waltl]|uniref:Uncharacterized protein n=1 Tax=Pleurodeles waltl TaxID=8319 RepID=A0AAV7VZ40_PLEWA|nr:hypothetical protein NDU88_000644 [Pleurodeles waltl]
MLPLQVGALRLPPRPLLKPVHRGRHPRVLEPATPRSSYSQLGAPLPQEQTVTLGRCFASRARLLSSFIRYYGIWPLSLQRIFSLQFRCLRSLLRPQEDPSVHASYTGVVTAPRQCVLQQANTAGTERPRGTSRQSANLAPTWYKQSA